MKFVKAPLTVFILGATFFAVTVFAALHFHWEDVHTYYSAANSLLKGRTDLYAPDFGDSAIMDYRYPPFFLILFLPFCSLSFEAVKFVWLWLNIITAFLTVGAIKRGFEIVMTNPARLGLVLFISFLASFKYFFMLVQHFNAHLIMLGLVFGSFCFLLKQKQLRAAFLMALAVTFKIVPVLTLPYFALKKQWLFLSATTLFIVVFNLIPAFYFGTETNFRLLKDWYYHVMVNNEFHETNGPINLSLKGQIERTLVEIDYTKRVEDTAYENVNVLSLSKAEADEVWKFSAAAMFLATMFLVWFSAKLRNRNDLPEPNDDRRDEQQNNFPSNVSPAFDSTAYHEFGLMICLMLLVAPRSNGYYFTALFFPLAALTHSLFSKKSRFNVSAFCLILTATVVLPLIPGRFAQRFLLVLGVDFYATLILWVALAFNLYKDSLDSRNEFGLASDGV